MKITINASWDGVSIETFNKVERVINDKSLDEFGMAYSLCEAWGVPESILSELSLTDLAVIYQKVLNAINNEIKAQFTNEIIINGEKRLIQFDAFKINAGKYASIKDAMSKNNMSYELLIAILCKKKSDDFTELKNAIEKQVPINIGIGVSSFFFQVYVSLTQYIAESLILERLKA